MPKNDWKLITVIAFILHRPKWILICITMVTWLTTQIKASLYIAAGSQQSIATQPVIDVKTPHKPVQSRSFRTTDDIVEALLMRPLFSATRRPPLNMQDNKSHLEYSRPPRLTAIIKTGSSSQSIFVVDGSKKFVIAFKGNSVGEFVVEDISDNSVTLSHFGSTIVESPSYDANLSARKPSYLEMRPISPER